MARFDESPIDPALLLALNALLTERSVTRAARRMGLTQSSMSHVLARLREQLGDPLLVRSGRGMALTPRAEAMAEPLRRALAALRTAVEGAGRYDPRTTTRRFVLACPDLLAPVLPALLAAMEREAPGAGLHVMAPPADLAAGLAAGQCDLALAPELDAGAGLVQRRLGRVHWAVVVRKGHPLARGELTRARWTAYPHVMTRLGNLSRNRVGDAIDAEGLGRTVRLVVPGQLTALFVAARSDHVCTVPRELVVGLARELGLVLRDPPIRIPALPVAALWHERLQSDAGHAWFREVVARVIQGELSAPALAG